MEITKTEEQHVESIKRFWEKNKRAIILGVLFFIVGFFGAKYYQHHKLVVAEQASLETSKMLDAMQIQDNIALKNHGKRLLTEFKKTPYAGLAALMLAKVDMEENNLKQAEENLLWVINNQSKGPVYHIALTRLARLYRQQKDYDKALELLNEKSNGFSSLYDEVKGDIYFDKGDEVNAYKYYEQALNAAPKFGVTPWLQLKRDNVIGAARRLMQREES